jgi:DNA polymerase (family 10)
VTLPVRLRAVADNQFGAAVVYVTGSIAHTQRLRERAAGRGLHLTEFGLTGPDGEVSCKTENDVYAALGLSAIPPELREDTGEVEAAAANTLPALVRVDEIRGVFHNHTTASDGSATLEQMARAAQELGFEYFGVGDHSQSLIVANGLTPDRVRAQWADIDRLNATWKGFRILKGTEADILADGSIDYPDDLLAGFDYVVASVHTHFAMSEAEMTARVCKALSHPAVTMLGHSTGRLLLRREGYKIALDEVLKTAAKYGKMIEINAQPTRLDLDWIHVKKAKALGIPIVINPDAHSTAEVALYRHGVDVARRGWLTAADVFNTRPLAEVMRELERRKAAWVR